MLISIIEVSNSTFTEHLFRIIVKEKLETYLIMKKIKILGLLIFLGGVCQGVTCNKQLDSTPLTLPEATHSGKNTMGALLNGQVWANGSYPGGLLPNGIDSRYGSGFIDIQGESLSGNVVTNVRIMLDQVNGVGQFTILPGNAHVNIADRSYLTDASHSGTVAITYFDATNHIAAGTFTFDAVNISNATDVMHVTSGRFDVLFSAN